MAEVTLTTALVGAASYSAGDKFQCSEDEARRLIEAGFAVPIVEAKVERAVKRPTAKEKRG